MKKAEILLLFLLVSILPLTNVLAQEYKWGEGKTFKNPQVKLISGKILTANRLTVRGSDLILRSGSLLIPKKVTINLSDVKEVRVATKDYSIVGTLGGAAVGVLAMFIAKSIYEEPTTTFSSGPGWTSTTTTTKIMPTEYKVDRYFDRVKIKEPFVLTTTEGKRRLDYPRICFHRPLEDYIRALLSCGFRISKFVEPAPTPEMITSDTWWEKCRRIPYFLMMEGTKRLHRARPQ